MFGELTIVPRHDIGPVGPQYGAPVTYHWSILWNLIWLLPLLVLIVILWLKPNRVARAWMVLVPVLAIHAVWMLCAQAFTFSSLPPEFTASITDAAAVLVLSLAALWALSYKLERRHWFRSSCYAVGIIAVMCVSAAPRFTSLIPSAILGSAFAYGVCVSVTLIALVAAGLCCRKRYTNSRFMIWLLVWIVPISAGVLLISLNSIVMVNNFVTLPPLSELLVFLAAVSSTDLVGPVVGLALYAVLLPFMILAFQNRIYRARFYSVFRVEDVAVQPVAVSDVGDTTQGPVK